MRGKAVFKVDEMAKTIGTGGGEAGGGSGLDEDDGEDEQIE